jgi:hypothetical protein
MTMSATERRAWQQLARRAANPSLGGSQRVAQWEIDNLYTLMVKLAGNDSPWHTPVDDEQDRDADREHA